MIQSKTNHLYYDISLLNNTKLPIIAKLFETRSQALLSNPSLYYLSLLRFLVPSAYIPLFIYPVDQTLGGNNPDNNFFSVTIRRAGVDYQTFIRYVAQNNLTVLDENYLYVYSYQQFIDAINVALSASFLLAGGSATIAPYITYDAKTGLFAMIGQYPYENIRNEYEIYMNNNVFSFFDNFKTKRFNNPQIININGKDNLIYIQNDGNNDFISHAPGSTIGVGFDSYSMIQEYKSTYSWNDCRSIVLISNNIPVAEEAISVNTGTSSAEYRKILTDYDINVDSNLRSYLQYSSTGEYRLLDLIGTSALYNVDIQVFFKTSNETLHPLYINAGEFISCKILFRNKKVKSGI